MIEAKTGVLSFVREWSRRMAEAGIENAAREARWIWERVAGRSGASDFLAGSAPVEQYDALRCTAAIERRLRGEPLAHILGETDFRHLTLDCDSRALIPRPETEGLVELVLAQQASGRALDVGTGTGCIALSLAREGGYDPVVAVDVSSDALALAEKNRRRTGLPVSLVQGDLGVGFRDNSFDVLVSNPPYLSDEEYAALAADVRDWEPALALRSGPDGLDHTRSLLREGIRLLRPRGLIALELDSSRAATAAQYAMNAGWTDVMVQDDLFGRARYLLARRSETDVG